MTTYINALDVNEEAVGDKFQSLSIKLRKLIKSNYSDVLTQWQELVYAKIIKKWN